MVNNLNFWEKFYSTFEKELKLCACEYLNNFKEKQESFKTCDIEYLRTKLINNVNEYFYSIKNYYSFSGTDKIFKLINIINYSLMLMSRDFSFKYLKSILNFVLGRYNFEDNENSNQNSNSGINDFIKKLFLNYLDKKE